MIEDIAHRRICIQCIGEACLAADVMKSGHPAVCDYCGRSEVAESIAVVAGLFEAMFDRHFERERELDFLWETPSGDLVVDIVADTGGLDTIPATDIQAVMADRHSDFEARKIGEATAFANDLTYVRQSANDRDDRTVWEDLEAELKTRRRFFSSAARQGFDRLFAGVHSLTARVGRPVVRMIGPGTDLPALFRARLFQSDVLFTEALLDPERLVGSPASRYARAGRMNPRGVAVFYGASNCRLAIAEVRPPVGSKVITARFVLQRPLRILDVEALEAVLVSGSLFDPGYAARLGRGAFLGALARRIRMPIMPDDEDSEYLITQVMADYLAGGIDPPLDGIAYGSAQGVDGFNVALFNGSARVRPGVISPDATREVHLFGGDEGEPETWTIWTEIDSRIAPQAPPAPRAYAGFGRPLPEPPDHRPETLVLDRSSLSVHQIRGVRVDAFSMAVKETFSDLATDPF